MRTVKTDTIEVWKAKIIEQEHINKLLEDIKAEIVDMDGDINGFYVHKDEVLAIIDKHISGKGTDETDC